MILAKKSIFVSIVASSLVSISCKQTGPTNQVKDLYVPEQSDSTTAQGQLYNLVTLDGVEYACRLKCPTFDSTLRPDQLRAACAQDKTAEIPVLAPVTDFVSDNAKLALDLIKTPKLDTSMNEGITSELDKIFAQATLRARQSTSVDPRFLDRNTCLKNATQPGFVLTSAVPKQCEVHILVQRDESRDSELVGNILEYILKNRGALRREEIDIKTVKDMFGSGTSREFSFLDYKNFLAVKENETPTLILSSKSGGNIITRGSLIYLEYNAPECGSWLRVSYNNDSSFENLAMNPAKSYEQKMSWMLLKANSNFSSINMLRRKMALLVAP